MNHRAIARFGAIGVALFAIQLDFFALQVALPTMARDLGSTSTDLQWAISSFMIALGISLVPASRIADLYGRKRALLAGLVMFGFASLLIAFAISPLQVTAARTLQGAGAAVVLTVGFSFVTNATSLTERPGVLGFLVGVSGVAMGVGPVVGGLLTATVGWRWVFGINVPVIAVAIIWAIVQLTEQRDTLLTGKRLRNLDWAGTVLLAVAVAGISLAIDDASTDSRTTTAFVALVGALAIVGFIVWERRASWPLVPPELWRATGFSALVIGCGVANCATAILIFDSTVWLQAVQGFSSLQAGLLFIPAAIGFAAAGPVAGRLALRVSGIRLIAVTLVAGACTTATLALMTNTIAYLMVFAFAAFFVALAFQFGNIVVQSLVQPRFAGAAAGVLRTFTAMTAAIGTVVAATGIEAFGINGLPSQHANTASLLIAAAGLLVVGVTYGIREWRVPAAPMTSPEPIDFL